MNTFVTIAVIFILACIFVASVIGSKHNTFGMSLYENAPPPPPKEPRRFYVKVSGVYLIDYDKSNFGWSTAKHIAIMLSDEEYNDIKASLPNNHTLELVIND